MCLGGAGEETRAGAGNYFFTSSQAESKRFLLSAPGGHVENDKSEKMKTSPRLCRHVVGRITDIGQGAEKRISAIFFQMCRRCKPDCVLGSPLEMGCLRTDQPSLDLTALWPVGKVEAAMARVVQVSGKCFGEEELWGSLGFCFFLLLLFSFFLSFTNLQT